MKCRECKKSTADDPQSFPWVHRRCVPNTSRRIKGIDPDRIINEYGVKTLEKTAEGRVVLANARKKWAAELVQPGDPEFNKLYGKQVKERAEAYRTLQEHSRKLWEQHGGRETKVYRD